MVCDHTTNLLQIDVYYITGLFCSSGIKYAGLIPSILTPHNLLHIYIIAMHNYGVGWTGDDVATSW